MPERTKGRKAKTGPAKKKSVIKSYERLYQSELTGAELDGMIDDAASSPGISEGTRKKVKKGLKDKKKGKAEPKRE
jgi:hypothetical protein